MFFIIGTRSREKTLEAGRFHCPNEGADRAFLHQQARRWFTVFFVPLIPLGKQAEWVRCQSCGATYGPDVLARHPSRA